MYSLYQDPEGKNIFTTDMRTGSNERKISLGLNVAALAMLGDDPRATIFVLQSQVEHLQSELKKYQANTHV